MLPKKSGGGIILGRTVLPGIRPGIAIVHRRIPARILVGHLPGIHTLPGRITSTLGISRYTPRPLCRRVLWLVLLVLRLHRVGLVLGCRLVWLPRLTGLLVLRHGLIALWLNNRLLLRRLPPVASPATCGRILWCALLHRIRLPGLVATGVALSMLSGRYRCYLLLLHTPSWIRWKDVIRSLLYFGCRIPFPDLYGIVRLLRLVFLRQYMFGFICCTGAHH